jgi:hypothetical protein
MNAIAIDFSIVKFNQMRSIDSAYHRTGSAVAGEAMPNRGLDILTTLAHAPRACSRGKAAA